ISENTIVIYTSDNGPHVNAWPDGGASIFRGEKNTQWDGGYRVPALIRWPGTIKPGMVINEIGSHQDVLPTIMAALGDTSIKEDLLKGRKIGDKTYKVHLDGYNLLPLLKGETTKSPRQEFLYWTDSGDMAALRLGDMKITYLRQNSKGMKVWETAMEELRLPIMANLRSDPFERASDEAFSYTDWSASKTYLFAPAAEYVTKWMTSFREFPPRAKPGTFGLGDVMEKMLEGGKK
ncbi:MAG: sulfatase-like hydrolase/transferase, partial [Pirellula sp.]